MSFPEFPVEHRPRPVAEPKNRPHSTITSLTANQITDTVNASEGCSRAEANTAFPETLQITPHGLVELAPRLAPYVPARADARDWPALIEAALWLSGELGVNRTLWSRACQVMGREYAAVALAIVSTRPAEHFTSGPGGYFAGMLRKFERGELCLSRTLGKLKDQTWGKERRERDTTRRKPDAGFVSRGRAFPAPARRLAAPSAYSESWQPSQELRDVEERIVVTSAVGSAALA